MQNVSLAPTEGIGLLTILELIALWTCLIKRTGWRTKPLELAEKERHKLATLFTGSLT